LRPRLYGRADCHLCEEMASQLRALGVEFDEIDVDSDLALKKEFGHFVPVLVDAQGNEICHYHLDKSALKVATGIG